MRPKLQLLSNARVFSIFLFTFSLLVFPTDQEQRQLVFNQVEKSLSSVSITSTANSALNCGLNCLNSCPDCLYFSTNSLTNSCSCGTQLSDTVTSQGHERTYADVRESKCELEPGYKLYSVDGGRHCIKISAERRNYTDAVASCRGRADQGMFLLDSINKTALLYSINPSPEWWWAGLSDMAVEGQFVWDNGRNMTSRESDLFSVDQPNNYNNQDCVSAQYRPGNFVFGDWYCSRTFVYACEIYL